MANTLKFGNGEWYGKEDAILAYNDENSNYKPLPFDFSRASSATRVNKAGLIETVGSGEPRIDFKDNTKGALLLEPQRTNSITYSNDLSQVVYDGDLKTDSVYGELGFNEENDAWRYTKTNGTNSGFINLTFSGTYTISFFIKKEASKGIKIYNFGDTSQFSTINIENGTYIGGVNTVKIEKFSNDWFRVSQTLTVSNGVWYLYLTDGIGNQIATSVTLQNFQIEQGSYPTSYIPTSGSAVTRVADECNNGGNEQVFNDSEGVLYAEIAALDETQGTSVLTISDSSLSDRLLIAFVSGEIRGEFVSGGGTITRNASEVFIENFNKIACSYTSNTFKVFVNGLQVGTTGTVTTTMLGIVELAFDRGDSANDFYGNVKDIRVYNTALTDNELKKLTQV